VIDVAYSHIGLVNTILEMRSAGYSWGKIRNEIAPDVSKIVLYKIANTSYEPKDPMLRYRLGLPMMREVEVCEEHGVVHEYDCTTETVKPKPKRKSKKRDRGSISWDNPSSAAASIMGHMDPELVKELVEILKGRKT
jgi:hypothetical protein